MTTDIAILASEHESHAEGHQKESTSRSFYTDQTSPTNPTSAVCHSQQFCTPKTKFFLAIITITFSSCTIGLSIIISAIVLSILHAFEKTSVHGEIYALMVSISVLFIVIGAITMLVTIRLRKGKFSVNSQGHVVNSKGERVNFLGEPIEHEDIMSNDEKETSPTTLKSFNFSNI